MARRIVPVTTETLADLPLPCASCAFWEVGPANRFALDEPTPAVVAKRAWVSETSSGWGGCGLLAYVDDVPAGFVLYAPPAYVPRAAAFPTAPVSSDAVLLMTLRVAAGFTGSGLGRVLVQSMGKDLIKRGVKAIEAYGASAEGCVLPVTYLESLGFVTVRDHARHPRLRLDLRTTVTWREDVEGAWGRLVGVVRPFPAGARQVSPTNRLTPDEVR
ncbi:MAG TPA: GNAT family N-acetyltransferase [Actinomycetes bacterium]